MRDIHVGKRGSEAAGDDPASGETQNRPGCVLVQKSGHVDDDVQISALVDAVHRDRWTK